ncbi:response regulator transcription factor [Trichothermofontia sichuanensis B231]|uniref:response regulator transcription factor n=1 Tax=Trichothermofontia sichuanensis TaxID=3045816 RepID=UPI002246C3B2|nr:response regulator transcription factor [Trichothermofontia sichuanensis]UZQ53470.1 response regulator transcription factor [Trichothermofontia sichuanensis B231]
METIRVVLIEDHDLTRIGLKTGLQQRSGIAVVGESGTAAGGLSVVQAQQPDVAVVDIGLPDRDGIELTRDIKQRVPQSRVLILTMHDNESSVLAAFAAGADSYCMKDVSMDKLVEALQATREGNAWIDPTIARIVLKQTQVSTTSPPVPAPHRRPISTPLPLGDDDLLLTDPLTERELEVLELIVAGCSNAEIAEKLYITVGTVKTHVRSILNKLCASDRTQAAVRALRSGLVD